MRGLVLANQPVHGQGWEDSRMKLSLEGNVAAGFALALVFLSAIGVVSYHSTERLAEDAAMMKHAPEILTRHESLLSTMTHAETGRRGYIITGNEAFRELYREALRGLPALRAIPIVAVASCAMVGDRDQVMAPGCNDYLEKPINPETFVSELEHFLRPAERAGAR